jgi:hypothetical protein
LKQDEIRVELMEDMKNGYKILAWKKLKERDNMKDLTIGGRIILEINLREKQGTKI